MRRRREEEPTINLTAMVDIVFLLLIFFMVGSTFQKSDSQIPVIVQGSGNLAPIARGADPRLLEINRQGQVFLDGRPTTLTHVSTELNRAVRAYPDLEVMVRADGDLPVSKQKEVLQTARGAGVRNLKL